MRLSSLSALPDIAKAGECRETRYDSIFDGVSILVVEMRKTLRFGSGEADYAGKLIEDVPAE